MAPWRKLIGATVTNRSRLHDRLGARIPVSRLLRNGPRALVTTALRLTFNRRPVLPWISYDATRRLADQIGPESRVLEFGSGASTLWFAARVGELISVERHPQWHSFLAAEVAQRGHGTARLRLAETVEDYTTLTASEAGDGFDLVLIDGWLRHQCAHAAIALLRPGGAIYLDNADRAGAEGTDWPPVRDTLRSFAAAHGASIEWFVDFAPTQLFVQTGMLVTLPAGTGTMRP